MSLQTQMYYKPSAELHRYPVGDSVCIHLTGCWGPTLTATEPSHYIPVRDNEVTLVIFVPTKQLHQATVDCQLHMSIATSALEHFKLESKKKGDPTRNPLL